MCTPAAALTCLDSLGSYFSLGGLVSFSGKRDATSRLLGVNETASSVSRERERVGSPGRLCVGGGTGLAGLGVEREVDGTV